jgi:hypothetical protein
MSPVRSRSPAPSFHLPVFVNAFLFGKRNWMNSAAIRTSSSGVRLRYSPFRCRCFVVFRYNPHRLKHHGQEQTGYAHGTTILAHRVGGARDSGSGRNRRRLLRQWAMGVAIASFPSVCKLSAGDVFLRNRLPRLPFQPICKPGFTRRAAFRAL